MKSTITMAFAALILLASCKKDTIVSSGKASLSLENNVAGQAFSLNKDYSINGKTYHFTAFRYWVSNVVLTNSNGQQVKVPHSYYLVEQTNAQDVQEGSFSYPATSRTSVDLDDVPPGSYKSISFAIGVDKAHNDNLSLQDGELQQMNNMTNVAWMWHTSYIFSTLEGTVSDGSTQKDLRVQTGTDENYATVQFDLGTGFRVAGTGKSTLAFNVDVAKVIEGIDTWTTPVVSATTPTVMSAVTANYKTKVFSVTSAK